MNAKWLILAVVVLGLVVAHSIGFAAPPTILSTQSTAFTAAIATGVNGELGLYLVGTWDNRNLANNCGGCPDNVTTKVQLVNPVSTNKWAFVTFWSADEVPLQCTPQHVTPNGQVEVSVPGAINVNATDYFFGAVKVLVTHDNGNPDLGLVGYRKEIHLIDSATPTLATISVSEIRLQAVPPKVLFSDRTPQDAIPDEVKNIACLCGTDGGNFGTCP